MMNILQRLLGRAKGSGVAGAYTEPRSGLIFPLQLGGLRRQGTGRPYAEGDREGESIPYGDGHAEATIYVTTVGQADFPDGGDNDFIREELNQAQATVRELERLGHYQSVKFMTAAPERLGTGADNLVWGRGAFFTAAGGRPMISFTYITALRSKIIKLRISGSDPNNKTLLEFPHALGDLISRQRSTPERG
jgi:hypothetical protein